MWTLLLSAALAGPPCEVTSPTAAARIPAPAILVLGERKGHHPDLLRAERLVVKLAKSQPVTVALEAIHRDHQGIIDRYEDGDLSPTDLPDLLTWSTYWGFDYWRYERLVTSSVVGASVLAVGLDPGLRPEDARLPIPPGYIHVLGDALGHPLPVELESRFLQTVAWRDHAIARTAIDGWDGEGFLVILADRLHVEGGLGISWQASRMTEAPVHAFVLANAGSPCYDGDKLFR